MVDGTLQVELGFDSEHVQEIFKMDGSLKYFEGTDECRVIFDRVVKERREIRLRELAQQVNRIIFTFETVTESVCSGMCLKCSVTKHLVSCEGIEKRQERRKGGAESRERHDISSEYF